MQPLRPGEADPFGDSPAVAPPLIDQYRLIRELGRGGMGVVYEAEDTLLHRRVAIKTLPHTAGDEPASAALLREARAAARLDHPNVVRVYHVGRWAGRDYLVLELITGGNLQERIAGGTPLAWEVATGAVADACRGLSTAHAAGLVHRDVKPSNLMCGNGTVKVTDFGLVRGAGLSTSTGNRAAGTPYYMSPEQCRGERADERSDVYSLGATYYHLLTGRPPFPGDTVLEVMFAHCSRPAPDPRAVVPDLPAGCAAVVLRAMHKEPADRYQSAAEMLEALSRLQPPVTAEPLETTGPYHEVTSPRPRGRWAVAVAVGAALSLAAVLVVALASPSGERDPMARVASVDQARVIQWEGAVRAVAVSPDGNWMATGGDSDKRGVVVWDLRSGKQFHRLDWGRTHSLTFTPGRAEAPRPVPILLAGSETGARYWTVDGAEEKFFVPHWTPEWGTQCVAAARGPYAAMGYGDGSMKGVVMLYRWWDSQVADFGRLGGAPVRQVTLSPREDLIAVGLADGGLLVHSFDKKLSRDLRGDPSRKAPPVLAFAPDRSILAVGTSETVCLWAPYSWRWEVRFTAPAEVLALAYSPDGKYLAAVGAGGMVTLWAARDGSQSGVLKGHRGAVHAVAWAPDGRTLVTGGSDGTVRLWPVPARLHGPKGE